MGKSRVYLRKDNNLSSLLSMKKKYMIGLNSEKDNINSPLKNLNCDLLINCQYLCLSTNNTLINKFKKSKKLISDHSNGKTIYS